MTKFNTWRSLIDGSMVFAIPDSAINRYNAPELSESDGETVDPWGDLVGSMDLVAVGNPTLNANSVNGVDAIDTDGTDDAYDYDQNLTGTVDEPVTILCALTVESLPADGIVTLWRDDGGMNEVLYRTDNNEMFAQVNGNTFTGGTPETGDQIVTYTADSDTGAALRINGSEVASTGAGDVPDGLAILDGGNNGSFLYSKEGPRRYMDALTVEIVIHDEELTGGDLTNEEERLESEANMDVL